MKNFLYLIPFLDKQHFKLGISSSNFNRIKKHNNTYGGIDYDNVYIISGSFKNIKHLEDIWKDNIPDDVSQVFEGKDGYTEVRSMKYFNICLGDVETFKYRMNLNLTKLSEYNIEKITDHEYSENNEDKSRIKKGFDKSKEYNINTNYKGNDLKGYYLSLDEICEEYDISESSSRRLWKSIRDEKIKKYKGEVISKNIKLSNGNYKIHILKKYTDYKYNKIKIVDNEKEEINDSTESVNKIYTKYIKRLEELNSIRNELKEINKIILCSIINDDINILKEGLKNMDKLIIN
tara:strand:- start:28 stop:900 length:873 start_codon:yes stop_codon:yes gene_type:complete